VRSPSPIHPPQVEPTEGALSELYRQLHDELLGFVTTRVPSKAASEDILQSAFLKAHRALSAGEVLEHPRAFLYQIVRNLLIDAGRAQKRGNQLREALSTESQVEGENFTEGSLTEEEENLISGRVARALPLFIAQVKEPYRRALELTELKGLSQAQAAEQEGVSVACMKARVRRGRLLVKDALLSCCAFELDRRGRVVECHPRQAADPDGSACGCN
jgi:RNA polymerase sigma-70 factor (ECF subfamily)